MLELNRATHLSPKNPVHAAYRVKTSVVNIEAQIESYTNTLRHNVSAPWSLYGAVYVYKPEAYATSDCSFLFEMQGTLCEAETYPVESDAPTQAIYSALELCGDATLECLGVWKLPSVAP